MGRAISDLTLPQGAGFHWHRISRLWAVSPVFLKRRSDYYEQLEKTQKGNLDITEWLLWSAACVGAAYDDACVCIERVGQVSRFWTRHRELPFNARQRRALEVALSANDAEQQWLTAKRIVKLTKAAPVTTSRDLARLELWGVVRKNPDAGGRSTRYSVVLAETPVPQLLPKLSWPV